MSDILTLEEWFELPQVGDNIKNIFNITPAIINSLFPDAVLAYLTEQQISPHSIIWQEALHKYASRYVMYKHVNTIDDLATVIEIKKDIEATALTEYNRFIALKQVINGDVTYDKLIEVFGNYNITKLGGWSDEYKSEDFTITDTWTRQTGTTNTVTNFESELKRESSTEIDYDPDNTQTTTHQKSRDEAKPSLNKRTYDGGKSQQGNYKEYGVKNGDFYNNYYKFIMSFPNAVDLFLQLTAPSYLLDIYSPNWLLD